MEKSDILALLEQLPGHEWNHENDYVEESINNPFDSGVECWHYTVMDEGNICVQKMCDGQYLGEPQFGSLRQLLWNKLPLKNVCEIYSQQYNEWKKQNNAVLLRSDTSTKAFTVALTTSINSLSQPWSIRMRSSISSSFDGASG